MTRYKGYIVFAVAVALGWAFEQVNGMVGWMTARNAEAAVMVPLLIGAVFFYFWAVRDHTAAGTAPDEGKTREEGDMKSDEYEFAWWQRLIGYGGLIVGVGAGAGGLIGMAIRGTTGIESAIGWGVALGMAITTALALGIAYSRQPH